MPNNLVVRQTLTEGLTLGRPGNRLLHTNATKGLHRRGHAHALRIEVRHDDLKALILLSNKIGDRYSDVVKVQGRCIRRPPTHLLIEWCSRKPLCVGWDEQHRNTGRTLATGSYSRGYVVRAHTARDIGFRAIHNVVIAVAHRCRLQARHIRATAGLGNTE